MARCKEVKTPVSWAGLEKTPPSWPFSRVEELASSTLSDHPDTCESQWQRSSKTAVTTGSDSRWELGETRKWRLGRRSFAWSFNGPISTMREQFRKVSSYSWKQSSICSALKSSSPSRWGNVVIIEEPVTEPFLRLGRLEGTGKSARGEAEVIERGLSEACWFVYDPWWLTASSGEAMVGVTRTGTADTPGALKMPFCVRGCILCLSLSSSSRNSALLHRGQWLALVWLITIPTFASWCVEKISAQGIPDSYGSILNKAASSLWKHHNVAVIS